MSLPKIVYILCPHANTGGHFVNWSLTFLTNQNTFWNRQSCEQSIISVPDSLEQNFHHHGCFVTLGFDSLVKQTDLINKHFKGPLAFLFVCHAKITNTKTNKIDVNKQVRQDYIQAVDWIQDNNLPFVFFDFDPPDYLNIFYNNRFPVDLHGNPQEDFNTVINQYEETFFKETKDKFSSEHIWDRRERLALIIDPFYKENVHCFRNKVNPKNYYTTNALWNKFPTILPAISEVIGVDIDTTKLPAWENVYNQWKQNHKQQFSRDFDLIINAIINNISLDLTQYNMNFFNEILIQHALIVWHNLNLKTWQLEKFPANAQDLHSLLEPNIHHI